MKKQTRLEQKPISVGIDNKAVQKTDEFHYSSDLGLS